MICRNVLLIPKGTLFLDEIGDLGYDAQAKLLRFIETGEFYKVGNRMKGWYDFCLP